MGVGENPPGVPVKLSQQGKFDGSERHGLIRNAGLVCGEVDGEFAQRDYGLIVGGSDSTQERPQPGEEFRGVEWLVR